jgi:hypothetical protein
MNCTEFQELLQMRLDGEKLAINGEVERHLNLCSSCRELEASAARLFEGLGTRIVPAPSDGLRDRIVSLILAQMESNRLGGRRWGRRVVGVAAIAAGLLLVAYLGNFWWSSHNTPGTTDHHAVVKKDEKAPRVPALSPLNIQEAGNALVALANRTADETLGQGRVLLPQGVSAPNLAVADAWQSDLEPSAQALRGAQDGMADSLEPVTTSARRAVNLFLREVSSIDVQKQ